MIDQVSPEELKQRLDAGEDILLIDVREPGEYAIARIEGSELKPITQIQQWAYDLPRDKPIVIYCHHGGRSAQAVMALSQQLDYKNVADMPGGIDAWSQRIDPSVQRY